MTVSIILTAGYVRPDVVLIENTGLTHGKLYILKESAKVPKCHCKFLIKSLKNYLMAVFDIVISCLMSMQ